MINIGDYIKLEVARKSDLGFMLTDGNDEILLHYGQAKKEHEVGDKVLVFIYPDKKRRPTATEEDVFATVSKPGFVTVKEVIPGTGVFVDINAPKDILVSKDNLPFNEELWPRNGEKLFVTLKVKGDALLAKPLSRFEVQGLHKKVSYEERSHQKAFVVRISEKGLGLITNDLMYVFVPTTQLRGIYHLGQEVEVLITKALEDEYYGSLNQQKENMIDTDKEIILAFLKNNHGKMPLTAKSSAEDVFRYLKMSRKAFKRAYGGLYKDDIISFDEKETKLVIK